MNSHHYLSRLYVLQKNRESRDNIHVKYACCENHLGKSRYFERRHNLSLLKKSGGIGQPLPEKACVARNDRNVRTVLDRYRMIILFSAFRACGGVGMRGVENREGFS